MGNNGNSNRGRSNTDCTSFSVGLPAADKAHTATNSPSFGNNSTGRCTMGSTALLLFGGIARRNGSICGFRRMIRLNGVRP